MKTKIYKVKQGYNEIAVFDDLEKATKFFADMIKGCGKRLNGIEGKGKNTKKAYFWGNDRDFGIEIADVDIYPNEKEARFAVFNGEEEED